jgi:hypothetical protein
MPSVLLINYYFGDHGVSTTPGFRMLMGVGRGLIFYFLPYVAASSIHKLFV